MDTDGSMSAHVQHSLLNVLAGVHEVADDTDSLIVDADIVRAQHLDQRRQRLHGDTFVNVSWRDRADHVHGEATARSFNTMIRAGIH